MQKRGKLPLMGTSIVEIITLFYSIVRQSPVSLVTPLEEIFAFITDPKNVFCQSDSLYCLYGHFYCQHWRQDDIPLSDRMSWIPRRIDLLEKVPPLVRWLRCSRCWPPAQPKTSAQPSHRSANLTINNLRLLKN